MAQGDIPQMHECNDDLISFEENSIRTISHDSLDEPVQRQYFQTPKGNRRICYRIPVKNNTTTTTTIISKKYGRY